MRVSRLDAAAPSWIVRPPVPARPADDRGAEYFGAVIAYSSSEELRRKSAATARRSGRAALPKHFSRHCARARAFRRRALARSRSCAETERWSDVRGMRGGRPTPADEQPSRGRGRAATVRPSTNATRRFGCPRADERRRPPSRSSSGSANRPSPLLNAAAAAARAASGPARESIAARASLNIPARVRDESLRLDFEAKRQHRGLRDDGSWLGSRDPTSSARTIRVSRPRRVDATVYSAALPEWRPWQRKRRP